MSMIDVKIEGTLKIQFDEVPESDVFEVVRLAFDHKCKIESIARPAVDTHTLTVELAEGHDNLGFLKAVREKTDALAEQYGDH